MDADQQVRLVGLERREREHIKQLRAIEAAVDKLMALVDRMMTIIEQKTHTHRTGAVPC